jgi:hypothetical protein
MLNDTPPEFERIQTKYLAAFSPAKKIIQCFKMSEFVLRQAQASIKDNFEHLNSADQNQKYIEIYYPEIKKTAAAAGQTLSMETNNTQDIIQTLTAFVSVLEKLGIEFQIVGSVASSAYGAARSTRDIDMVCALDATKVETLVSSLKSEFYIDKDTVLEAIQNKSSFNVLHLKTMFKIDVFVLNNQSYDLESFKRKKLEIFSDSPVLKVFISSPEDVIISKLNWYRMGNESSERQWNDVQTLYQVQRENLDFNYLDTWCEKLRLSDLWKRIFTFKS